MPVATPGAYVLFSLVLTLLGCSTPCDNAVGVMVAVGEMAEADKAKAVESCKADYEAKPDEKANVDALAACADKSGDEQKVCAHNAIITRLAGKARADNDWGMVGRMCETYADATACPDLLKEGLGASTKKVTDLRDKGEDAMMACIDLKAVAKSAGAEATAGAEALCNEAEAAEYGAEGVKEAKENIAAKKADLPLRCGMAMDKFKELSSDWSKQRAKETAQVCYGDLGKIVMAAELPGMKYVCDYKVQQVYDNVKAFDLHDAELDAFMAQAEALCAKKG